MEINGIVIFDKELLSELIKKAAQSALRDLSPTLGDVMQEEDVLTRNEAPLLLKLSPNTITKFVRKGKLKAGVAGGKYLFKKSEVMKCIFKNK